MIKLLKTIAIVILTLLLLLSVVAIVSTRAVIESMEPSSLKPVFQEAATKVLLKTADKNQSSETMYNQALILCQIQSGMTISLSQFGIADSVTISCDEMKSAGDLNNSIKLLAGKVYDKAYSGTYGCVGFDCITKKQPFGLITKESIDYFSKLVLKFMVVFAILLILQFFLFSYKKNFFFMNGVLWMIISLPLIGILSFMKMSGFTISILPANLMSAILNSFRLDFIIIAVISLVFLAVGYYIGSKNKESDKK